MEKDEQNQNREPLLKTEASIVNNQVRPKPIDPDTLRSKSVSLVCPFCKSQINTNVEQICSWSNLCCSIFTTPITWAIFQCCRKKDYNCYDTEHSCPNCKIKLGQYKAC